MLKKTCKFMNEIQLKTNARKQHMRSQLQQQYVHILFLKTISGTALVCHGATITANSHHQAPSLAAALNASGTEPYQEGNRSEPGQSEWDCPPTNLLSNFSWPYQEYVFRHQLPSTYQVFQALNSQVQISKCISY